LRPEASKTPPVHSVEGHVGGLERADDLDQLRVPPETEVEPAKGARARRDSDGDADERHKTHSSHSTLHGFLGSLENLAGARDSRVRFRRRFEYYPGLQETQCPSVAANLSTGVSS
jgi:hypothetical protein